MFMRIIRDYQFIEPQDRGATVAIGNFDGVHIGHQSVIDLARAEAIRSIPVAGPEGAQERMQVTVIWSQDGERIYVAETGDDTIAEVDYASGRVLRRLEAGDGGDGLAILP